MLGFTNPHSLIRLTAFRRSHLIVPTVPAGYVSLHSLQLSQTDLSLLLQTGPCTIYGRKELRKVQSISIIMATPLTK
ncbi:hypothetical protein SKAU_G00024810 [Synaphobranchus kaupii]|uniref:Uncharacterized protein n=1 Tax=Synaphobranchus kaupii TaxID=118154 RepID=A0A9Q1JDH5_SYNKA|nr:hypothetical protein SKAU_G00024810 [Synaphobranchus kaupii]